MNSDELNQNKVLRIEHKLNEISSSKKYHQSASQVQILVTNYVENKLRNDFLDELFDLLNKD